MFEVNKRNTRKRCEICSKLTLNKLMLAGKQQLWLKLIFLILKQTGLNRKSQKVTCQNKHANIYSVAVMTLLRSRYHLVIIWSVLALGKMVKNATKFCWNFFSIKWLKQYKKIKQPEVNFWLQFLKLLSFLA